MASIQELLGQALSISRGQAPTAQGTTAPADLIKQLQALMQPAARLAETSTSGGRHDPYMGSVSNDMQTGSRRMVLPPSRGRDEFAADAVPPMGAGVSLDNLDPTQLIDQILMLQSGPVSHKADTPVGDIARTKKGNMSQNIGQKALNKVKREGAMSDRNIPTGMSDYDVGETTESNVGPQEPISTESELMAIMDALGIEQAPSFNGPSDNEIDQVIQKAQSGTPLDYRDKGIMMWLREEGLEPNDPRIPMIDQIMQQMNIE